MAVVSVRCVTVASFLQFSISNFHFLIFNFGCPFAFSSTQCHHLICRASGKGFIAAVGLDDVYGVNTLGGSEAEMGARVVAAQVTVAGIHPAQQAAASRLDNDFGAVGIALER